MKSILVLLVIVCGTVVVVVGQDKEIEEQIKQANDTAKQMGVKSPDVPKLMEESAKEDAEDSPSPSASASAARPQVKVDLPAGTAKGSITFDGATSELKFATAFVDQKDSRKPIVLLLTDQKLPSEKWTSEFDLMRDHTKWSGIVVFLDKGEVYRTDVHTNGKQSSVSGMFAVSINDPMAADLVGVAKSDSSSKDKNLDVSFHATRK
ncbi:MAG: hypothetical protein ACJ8M1_14610 [Chthoniobacterales bacterium]